MIFLLLSMFCLGDGFLLETNNHSTGSLVTGQENYLKLSEYYKEKKEQRSKLAIMLLNRDNTLKLLASQTQQKFEELEYKVLSCSQQKRPVLWEEKYRDLAKNYSQLQKKFEALEAKYFKLENDLQNETSEIVAIETEVMEYNNVSDKRLQFQEYDMQVVKNKTDNLSEIIQSYEQIKPIRQIKEFIYLIRQVQHLTTQTNVLLNRHQARNQDLLGLFKQLNSYGNTLIKLKEEIHSNIQSLESQDHFYNQTLYDLILKLLVIERVKIPTVLKKIQKADELVSMISEKVALTASMSNDRRYSSSEVVRFENVIQVVGIKNISSFRGKGKFTIEKNGLYQVTVSILSNTLGGYFNIYKNGKKFPDTYISNDSQYDLATTVIALDLLTNDTVWVQPGTSIDVDDEGSLFSIVKLK